MDRSEMKRSAAEAAVDYLRPRLDADTVIGVGTGSTTAYFITALAAVKPLFAAAVASSEDSARRLREQGIAAVELNDVGSVSFYVDGADEVNRRLQLLKGGGGALTREKVIAATAREFLCIADESKMVRRLGRFPLAVEVIPMARSYVAREMVKLGGDPVFRDGWVTDNGNHLIDVRNLALLDPRGTEKAVNQIAGVVTNGLFAERGADKLLLGTATGTEMLLPS